MIIRVVVMLCFFILKETSHPDPPAQTGDKKALLAVTAQNKNFGKLVYAGTSICGFDKARSDPPFLLLHFRCDLY
ncbi:hypothetical protein DFH08DRAFT_831869 [Mycena albidolilacea]|uniref:Secreted protein n=1 Tax=Mycena albidolilacea TaxID=1033008 RepID=A0AAD7AV56_9AGAR|nr:hypothetical protein DFH08DRAFT_831869 [Mycena albidolilacea]